jgi:hypothetical protein
MKAVGIIFLVWMGCGSVSAEFRMWSDVDGTRFEGEFDKALFGEIVVRDRKRKGRFIPFDKLSKKDFEYVQQKIPPDVEIDFKKKTRVRPEMEWTIGRDQTTLYSCTVRVTKKSGFPSQAKLKAELFLIAEEVDGGNYILMHWEPSVFVFPEGKDSVYEFATKEVPFRIYPTWGEVTYRLRGQRYIGYIVIVSSLDGTILESDVSLPRLPWLTDDLSASVIKLREIYTTGRGSSHSRHFNSSFRKTQTPRIKWHRRTLDF